MKKKILKYILYILFFGSILASGIYYFHFYRNQGKSNEMYKELGQTVERQEEKLHEAAKEQIKEKTQDKKKPVKKEEAVPEQTYLDLPALQKDNQDVYAWIEIPDTNVNYPVLTSKNDDFYLMHNLDGSYGYPGCIYSNSVNGTQFDSEVTVLYGHNMKNETMFGSLNHFCEEKYFADHPYIYIYTENKVLVYEIRAVTEWDNQNLLQKYSEDSEADKNAFVTSITEENAVRIRESSQDVKGNVLVLSTCVRGQEKKRLLIVGEQI